MMHTSSTLYWSPSNDISCFLLIFKSKFALCFCSVYLKGRFGH